MISATDSQSVQLKVGTTVIENPPTLAACKLRKEELKLNSTKTFGEATYNCIETHKTVVKFGPNVCPAPPPSETRTQECPAGYSGTWSQSRAYVTMPYPACSLVGEWSPAQAPTDACQPIPPPDTDADGVPDATDRCPAVAASTPDGCPVEPPVETWTHCANERELCAFTGTRRVRYGAGTTWVNRQVAAVNGGVICSNAIFGDPIYGQVKTCELSSIADPAPEPTGTATLQWTAPTHNTDGTPLTDLTGYRLLYGREAHNLDRSLMLESASVPPYVMAGLTSGQWYFAIVAINAAGAESDASNVAGKVVQ